MEMPGRGWALVMTATVAGLRIRLPSTLAAMDEHLGQEGQVVGRGKDAGMTGHPAHAMRQWDQTPAPQRSPLPW